MSLTTIHFQMRNSMHRSYWLAAGFFILVTIISACNKDDDDMNPSNTDPVLLTCGEFDLPRTLTNDLNRPVDYLIDCANMRVQDQLVIEPGVVIAFAAGSGLDILEDGSISAVGTDSEPILFTGIEKVKGSWAGLLIRSSSPLNKLQYVIVEYGGQTSHWFNSLSGNVSTGINAHLLMNHTQLNKSMTYGLNVYHLGPADVILNNNSYKDNQIPMRLNGKSLWIPSPTDDYSGNVENNVEVMLASSEISENTTWRKINVPYKVTGSQNLALNANLTIEPGVQIEMSQNTGINVNENGGLKMVGVPQDRIILRGELGVKGSWHKIFFMGTNSINEIGYADILHGGQDNTLDKGTISVWYNGRLNIHDVHFEELDNCAVAYRLSGGQVSNPNLILENITYTDVPCESVVY